MDRAKALIRSGGESISSAALEAELRKHRTVRDAAVIGVPDEKWGERPLAVIVLQTTQVEYTGRTEQRESDLVETLKRHLSATFPKFWLPDRFVFVDEIPKTGVGKSDKQTLRQRFAAPQKCE